MKKLYFIRANQTKYGGAEVYLSRLSAELKRRGMEYDIIHSPYPKWLPSWVRVLLFDRWVCRQKKQDELYFSLERISCPDIYRAGDGVHKVFIEVEEKSRLNPLHTVYLFLEKRCFSNAKKIIANSKMIKQQIIDTYAISPKKIEVVYNGVTVEPVERQSARQKLESEFGLESKNEKILLYVGSGFKRKGVKEMLELLAMIQDKPFKAFIVGKEKKLSEYQALTVSLGLEKKVVFTGPRDDVATFYAAADIFLFPTRYEPFSNVILEAMAYGNAVITTWQNGASEILSDAFVMHSPSDTTILPLIEKLMEDTVYLEDVKQQNIEQMKAFTIEKNVEKTLKVIDEVIH